MNTEKAAYVSRGALKLKSVLQKACISPSGKTILDIGSSHGGFVQIMLFSGAKKIYAVDVGKNLLDWRLRNLPQVIVMENTNARYLDKNDFTDLPDIGLIDVSFISLKKIIPVVFNIVTDKVLALVKPQFEANYIETSKGKGIITDNNIHKRVINEIIDSVDNSRWEYVATYPSEVKGRKGNQEYFLYYERI